MRETKIPAPGASCRTAVRGSDVTSSCNQSVKKPATREPLRQAVTNLFGGSFVDLEHANASSHGEERTRRRSSVYPADVPRKCLASAKQPSERSSRDFGCSSFHWKKKFDALTFGRLPTKARQQPFAQRTMLRTRECCRCPSRSISMVLTICPRVSTTMELGLLEGVGHQMLGSHELAKAGAEQGEPGE